MKDLTEGKLDEARALAASIGDQTLERCIARIKNYDNMEPHYYTETTLYPDGDPYSFYFVRRQLDNPECISNGGVIFHDYRNGDPGHHIEINPDLSKAHWSIHT